MPTTFTPNSPLTTSLLTRQVVFRLDMWDPTLSDILDDMTVSITLVGANEPVWDPSIPAILYGWPVVEQALNVNESLSFDLRCNTDTIGGTDFIRTRTGGTVRWSISATGTANGASLSLFNTVVFDVDTAHAAVRELVDIW